MECQFWAAYEAHKRSREKSWGDFFKRKNRLYIMLFIILTVLLIITIIIGIPLDSSIFFYVLVILDLVGIIVFNLYDNLDMQRNSRNNLKSLDEESKELLKWLIDVGYGEKNKIKQVCVRCQKYIKEKEEEKKKLKNIVNKAFSILIVPMGLKDLEDLIRNAGFQEIIQFLINIFFIYLLIHIIVKYLQEYRYRNLKGMKKMLNNLQNVLDRNFPIENEDIIKS